MGSFYPHLPDFLEILLPRKHAELLYVLSYLEVPRRGAARAVAPISVPVFRRRRNHPRRTDRRSIRAQIRNLGLDLRGRAAHLALAVCQSWLDHRALCSDRNSLVISIPCHPGLRPGIGSRQSRTDLRTFLWLRFWNRRHWIGDLWSIGRSYQHRIRVLGLLFSAPDRAPDRLSSKFGTTRSDQQTSRRRRWLAENTRCPGSLTNAPAVMINDFDFGGVADVFQRVAVQDDKICQFAGLKRSPVRGADDLRAVLRCANDGIHWIKT